MARSGGQAKSSLWTHSFAFSAFSRPLFHFLEPESPRKGDEKAKRKSKTRMQIFPNTSVAMTVMLALMLHFDFCSCNCSCGNYCHFGCDFVPPLRLVIRNAGRAPCHALRFWHRHAALLALLPNYGHFPRAANCRSCHARQCKIHQCRPSVLHLWKLETTLPARPEMD